MNYDYLLIELIDDIRSQKTFTPSANLRINDTRYADVRLFLRYALNMQPLSAIVLIARYTDVSKIDQIIEYIKINNITKLYIFVEDIVRLYVPNRPHSCIDRSMIQRLPGLVEALEFKVIREILDQTKLDYELYHCEYNASFFEKKYNLTIKYFDVFSACESARWKKYSASASFKYKICCFNLRRQIERFYIVMLLSEYPDVLLTLCDPFKHLEILNDNVLPVQYFRPDIKEKILNQTHYNQSNEIKFEWDTDFSCAATLKNIVHSRTVNGSFESFLTVVTETCYSSLLPNIGEKTIKPMLARRPFILLAPPGTLTLLKKLGFKTFDRWWDESYDSIIDHHARFEAVHDTIIKLLDKDKIELARILSEMQNVLNHNIENLNFLNQNMLAINHFE